MKTLKITTQITVAILFLLSVGCNDILDQKPIGLESADVSYKTFAGAMGGVNGIYAALTTAYRYDNSIIEVDLASDDLMDDSYTNSIGYSRLDYFELKTSDSYFYLLWANHYRIIFRSNVALENIPSTQFPTTGPGALNSENRLFRDQFLGEAYFLRALAYFNLVRVFGDVPLITNTISSLDGLKVPRSSVDKIYTQIVSDLDKAIPLLPKRYSNSGQGNEIGRATVWSAKALLADVHLTRKNYSLAKELAKDIINNSGKTLAANYADNFTKGQNENIPESLFEVQFSNNNSTGNSDTRENFSYFMGPITNAANGNPSLQRYRPTDNNHVFNESGFSNGLIQMYDQVNDKRFAVNFRKYNTQNIDVYLTDKYYVPGNTVAVGNTNFPVYRLAEMYLIAAEAINEQDGPTAEALGYVNTLRARAFGNTNFNFPAGLSKDQMRETIREERRRELAVENKRWFDLKRYGFDYANNKLKAQKRDNFKADFLVFPIPEREIIINNNLTQNNGYL